MLKKLRIKFVCAMMIVFSMLLGIIICSVLEYTAYTMEQKNIQMLESLSHGPVRFGKFEADAKFPIMSVSVNKQGEVTAVTGSDFGLTEDQIHEITHQIHEMWQERGLLIEYDLRFQWDRSPRGDRILFADTSPDLESFRRLVFSCSIFGLLGLVAFFLLSLILARWMVKPVEEAWNQQRQFIADASHELKTPLAVIMTNAELLQAPVQTQEQRNQFSGSILTTSRQMRYLVEGLLELARVDNGAVKQSFASLDLSEIAEDAALSFEVMFFEQGLSLNTGITAEIRLNGSASHLRQVVDILLDNARKYTTPGGAVQLSLVRHGSTALLSVSGPGENISPDDLKKIFQRFYRIDNARPRDGSYGLGLAIAKSIAEDHGGRIWAESREGINTFFVQLPIS